MLSLASASVPSEVLPSPESRVPEPRAPEFGRTGRIARAGAPPLPSCHDSPCPSHQLRSHATPVGRRPALGAGARTLGRCRGAVRLCRQEHRRVLPAHLSEPPPAARAGAVLRRAGRGRAGRLPRLPALPARRRPSGHRRRQGGRQGGVAPARPRRRARGPGRPGGAHRPQPLAFPARLHRAYRRLAARVPGGLPRRAVPCVAAGGQRRDHGDLRSRLRIAEPGVGAQAHRSRALAGGLPAARPGRGHRLRGGAVLAGPAAGGGDGVPAFAR